MRPSALAIGLLAVWGVVGPRAAAAGGSRLALPILSGAEKPELRLAQRVIEREWGPSEDSVYVIVDVPGWREEAYAMGLSAAAPGLGQVYAGEWRGLWFAVAEAAGWTARTIFRRRGDELRDDAARYAGPPAQAASNWSFARWSAATESDPADLEALYAADREAFYDLIGSDPRYLAGWAGDPSQTRGAFSELRRHSNARLRYARFTGEGLWMNHLAAAIDALRAARLQNLRLQRNLELKVRSGWRDGRPTLSAALERSF
jgi:hypothetical protein